MNGCTFKNVNGKCGVLIYPECPKNCKFAKTEEEFEQARENAAKILKNKGLQVVTKYDCKRGYYVTTEKIN